MAKEFSIELKEKTEYICPICLTIYKKKQDGQKCLDQGITKKHYQKDKNIKNFKKK